MRFLPSLAFILFLGLIAGQKLVPEINPECLHCLCMASSKCAVHNCHRSGAAYYCGPFQVSYGYWVDGGKPGSDPRNPQDFEHCLNDRTCAEQAVKGYMSKWGHDCDNNGVVDCDDYARVHKAGPYGCNGTWATQTDFWKAYTDCYYEE